MDAFELVLGVIVVAAVTSWVAMSKRVDDTLFSRIYAATAWVFAAVVIALLFG